MSKKIQDLLEADASQLARILETTKRFKQLEEKLKNVLPEGMLPHVVIGGYQNAVLTLVVDSSAWATQCRFLKPRLLSYIGQIPAFTGISDIVVKIGYLEPPIVPTEGIPKKEDTRPSPEIKAQFAALAEGEECSKLKSVLERLAGKIQKPDVE